MKKYLSALKTSKLFKGIEEKEIEAMLGCLSAKKKTYKKGEYVFFGGESKGLLAVLAEGRLHIQNVDYWGNRSIINIVEEGEMFAEAYVFPESSRVLNDVVSVENSTVIFFDVKHILTVCSSACKFHTVTIQNLFSALSEKNRRLLSKMEVISKRTTREKIISYLSSEAKKHNTNIFEIPFNRQQLADYLSVDRSALSKELCKMRDEGLIEFRKNRFVLNSI